MSHDPTTPRDPSASQRCVKLELQVKALESQLTKLQEQVDQTLLSVQHFADGSQLIHGPHGITIVDGPAPYSRGNEKRGSHT
jgi:hypothetical protein